MVLNVCKRPEIPTGKRNSRRYFSTTSQPEAINRVYQQNTDYYICKPGTFSLLIKAIQKVLTINWDEETEQAPRDKFLLSFT